MKINPGGAINAEGHRLRHLRLRRRRLASSTSINESVKLYNQGPARRPATRCSTASTSRTTVDPAGPWNKIADSTKLAELAARRSSSRSAARATGPGVQAWYNQFLAVDPTNANHVLRRSRGGLRDHERRRALDHDRPVLELLLPVLEADSLTRQTAATAARTRRTPTSTRWRSARSAASRRLRRQRRRRLQPPGQRHGRTRTGNAHRLEVPQRRHDGRAAVLLRRRRQADADDALAPDLGTGDRSSSAAACRTTAARCSGPGSAEDGLELRR